ncbi:MAG: response regulator, partial [Saprospiraceae bacterium]|nr:response regulator [Saprospiraceae bacterium]
LWVGTWGAGLNLFDPATGESTRYLHNSNDPAGLPDSFVSVIIRDEAGYLWIGTQSGLSRFDPETETFKNYYHDPEDPHSLSGSPVRALYIDSRSTLWVGSGFPYNATADGGLNRYRPEEDDFVRYLADPGDPHSLVKDEIRVIYEDSNGNFWVGTEGPTLHLMDRSTGVFTPMPSYSDTQNGLSIPDAQSELSALTFVFEDDRKNLWIGAFNAGLTRYDPSTNTTQFIEYLGGSHYPWTIMESRQGNIWIGSGGGGGTVIKASPTVEWLSSIRTGSQVKGYFQTEQGDEIISCTFGLLLYNDEGFVTWNTNRQGIPLTNLWKIRQAPDGDLWMNRFRAEGLVNYDPETGIFRELFADSLDNRPALEINDLVIDENNTIWMATEHSGLAAYFPRDNTLETRIESTDKNSSSPLRLSHLYYSRKGQLWVAGQEGRGQFWYPFLKCVEPESRQIKHLDIPLRNSGYWRDIIPGIAGEDEKGDILTFYSSDIIIRINPNTDEFELQLRELSGIPGQYSRSCIMDDEGYLWWAGSGNLVRIDTASFRIRVFGPRDGLQHFPYFTNAVYKSAEGQLYFCGKNGCDIIYPSRISGYSQFDSKEQITLTSFEVYDTSAVALYIENMYKQSSSYDPIHLDHTQNQFTIRFSAMDFRFPELIDYEARLLPLEDNWRQLENDPAATYYSVPPGTYNFHTRIVGSNMEDTQLLTITVHPPWWLTIWAKIGYAILVLTVFYFFYRWRTRTHRRKLARQQQQLKRERRLNERLTQIDRLKDQFLANTSHELRTPLQGIIGLSESVRDNLHTDPPENQVEDLNMIISSGKRLANLVNDILDFSKLKNYTIELQTRPVDLHTLTGIVLRNYQALIKGKDIELINEVPPSIPPALGDENRLQQVLYNLVGNAIKFTEKGYVKVGAEVVKYEDENEDKQTAENPELQVFVKDTGIGISPEKQSDIFREFEQGDGSISRQFGGTGLGLSISKKLVELHDGNMWLESEEGEGSTFFFSLPLADPDSPDTDIKAFSKEKESKIPAEDELAETSRMAAVSSGRDLKNPLPAVAANEHDDIHILTVDDESINQKVLEKHLSGAGYQLTQAMNGAEALKQLDNGHDFDLVLLDLMMPRMSGYEVCREIRQRWLPSELPVIMITAKDQVNDIVQGLSAGANDYLTKPFNKDELLARIQTQLDLHRIFSVTGRFVPNKFIRTLGHKTITDV